MERRVENAPTVAYAAANEISDVSWGVILDAYAPNCATAEKEQAEYLRNNFNPNFEEK